MANLTTSENADLKQADIRLNKKYFHIEEDGLRIITKTINSKTETFVDFEEIGSKVVKERTGKIIWIVLSVICLILAVFLFIRRSRGFSVGNGAEAFYIVFGFIFVSVYVITRKNLVYLAKSDNTNALTFLADKPDKATLDKFIEELLKRRDAYLLNRYSTFDILMPYELQMDNLTWLYNNEIIEKDDFLKKVKELNELFSDTLKNENGKVKIGFRPPVE